MINMINLNKNDSISLNHPKLNDLIVRTVQQREEWNRMKGLIKGYSSGFVHGENPFTYFDSLLNPLFTNQVDINNIKIVTEEEYNRFLNILRCNHAFDHLKTTENPTQLNIRAMRCEIAFCLMLNISFKHCLVIKEDISATDFSGQNIDNGDVIYNSFYFDVKCVKNPYHSLLVTNNKKNTNIDIFVSMYENQQNGNISFVGAQAHNKLDFSNTLVYAQGTVNEKEIGTGFKQSELTNLVNACKNAQNDTKYQLRTQKLKINPINTYQTFNYDIAKINARIDKELNEINQNIFSNEDDPNQHIIGCYATQNSGIEKMMLESKKYGGYYKYFYNIPDYTTYLTTALSLLP